MCLGAPDSVDGEEKDGSYDDKGNNGAGTAPSAVATAVSLMASLQGGPNQKAMAKTAFCENYLTPLAKVLAEAMLTHYGVRRFSGHASP